MGCGASAASGPDAARPLEALLIAAVVEAKKRADTLQGADAGSAVRGSLRPSFNGLLLRFGAMRPGFQRIRALHENMQPQDVEGRMVVPLQSLDQVVQDCAAYRAAVAAVKAEAGANSAAGQCIDLDQFIIIVTILQLKDPEHAFKFPEIHKALQILEKAFTYFDSSADGVLEREELAAALASGSKKFESVTAKIKRPSKKHRGPGDMLFDVLDLDKSGTISFQEFLLGIVKIVLSPEMEQHGEEDLGEIKAGSDTHTHLQRPDGASANPGG